jgi:hypothetical protein
MMGLKAATLDIAVEFKDINLITRVKAYAYY